MKSSNAYIVFALLSLSGCAQVTATRTGPDGSAMTVSYRRFLTSYNAEVADQQNRLTIKVSAQSEVDKLKELIGALAGAGLLVSGVIAGGALPAH